MLEKRPCVYKLLIGPYKYYGSSSNAMNRACNHRNGFIRGDHTHQDVYNKYGSHEFVVIDYYETAEQAMYAEDLLVSENIGNRYCLNILNVGGLGRLGQKTSGEHKAKIAASLKATHACPEWRARQSAKGVKAWEKRERVSTEEMAAVQKSKSVTVTLNGETRTFTGIRAAARYHGGVHSRFSRWAKGTESLPTKGKFFGIQISFNEENNNE